MPFQTPSKSYRTPRRLIRSNGDNSGESPANQASLAGWMQSLKQRALGALRKNDELATDTDDEVSYQRKLAAEEEAEENNSVAFENLGKILGRHTKQHDSSEEEVDDSGSDGESHFSGGKSLISGEKSFTEHRPMGDESENKGTGTVHEFEKNVLQQLQADSRIFGVDNGRDNFSEAGESSQQGPDRVEAIEILSSEEEEVDVEDDGEERVEEVSEGEEEEAEEEEEDEEEEDEEEEEEEEEDEEEEELEEEEVMDHEFSDHLGNYGGEEQEVQEQEIQGIRTHSNGGSEDFDEGMTIDSIQSRNDHGYRDYSSLQTESFHSSNEVYTNYYDDSNDLHMGSSDANVQQLYNEDDNVAESNNIENSASSASIESAIDNVLNDAATLLPIFNILDEQSHSDLAVVQDKEADTKSSENAENTKGDAGRTFRSEGEQMSELQCDAKVESESAPDSKSMSELEPIAKNKAKSDTEVVVYKPQFEAFPYIDISQYMPKSSAASISALKEVSPFEQNDESKLNNYRTMAQLASARLKDNNISFSFGSFFTGSDTENVPDDTGESSFKLDAKMEDATVVDSTTTKTRVENEDQRQSAEVPVIELKSEEVSQLASSAFSALLKSDIFQGLKDKIEIPEVESDAETEPFYVEEYSSVAGDSPAASVYDGKASNVISLVSETVLEGAVASPFEVEFDYNEKNEEHKQEAMPVRKRVRKQSISVEKDETDKGEKKRARHAPTKGQNQEMNEPSTPSRRTRSQQQESLLDDNKKVASPVRKSARNRRSKAVEPEALGSEETETVELKERTSDNNIDANSEQTEEISAVEPEEVVEKEVSDDEEIEHNESDDSEAIEEKVPRRSTRAHQSISDEQIKEAIEQSNSGRKTRSKKTASSTAARSKTAKVEKASASPRKIRRTNVNKK